MSKALRGLLKPKTKLSKSHLALYAVAIAVVGGIILLVSHAAPNPNLPGDLNADNTVNGLDLSLLLGDFNTTNAAADINKDGTVNGVDLSILLSHWGESVTQNSIPKHIETWAYDGAAGGEASTTSGSLVRQLLTYD
jgi:hypothetical protein